MHISPPLLGNRETTRLLVLYWQHCNETLLCYFHSVRPDGCMDLYPDRATAELRVFYEYTDTWTKASNQTEFRISGGNIHTLLQSANWILHLLEFTGLPSSGATLRSRVQLVHNHLSVSSEERHTCWKWAARLAPPRSPPSLIPPALEKNIMGFMAHQ